MPPQPEAVARPADPASQTFDNTRVHAVTVPTTLAQAPVDVILVARTGTAAGFRVERLNLGAMPRVREGFAGDGEKGGKRRRHGAEACRPASRLAREREFLPSRDVVGIFSGIRVYSIRPDPISD